MAAQKQPIDKLRDACLKRGVNGIKSFGTMFRIYDDDSNHQLDKREFSKGVHDYGANLSDAEIDALFTAFDKDGSGSINFNELLVALRPPMSKSRITLIELAFKKLDVTGDGFITVEDLKSKYDVSHHKKYASGEWTANQVLKEFLDSFQADKDDKVTYNEFVDYYAGVSASIDQDVYFDYMMRQAWKL